MLAHERQASIMKMLHETKGVKNSEIAARFGVNELTVRRDLNTLQERGLLRRIYGGAVICEDVPEGPVQSTASFQDSDEYIQHPALYAIAKEAIKFVREGDKLFLGNGFFTEKIAQHLRRFSYLTIVTSSLAVANQLLNTNNDVYILGGQLNHNIQSVFGEYTLAMLKNLHADKTFISGEVSLKHGVTGDFIPSAEGGRIMIENSDMTVFLCESREIGRTALHTVCPISALDIIITDDGITPEQKQALEAAGTEVKVAAVNK